MAYSNFYARFYAIRQQAGQAMAAVWRFYPSRFYFLAVGLWQLLTWWQAIFIYRNLTGNLLVLHYNVDFGIDLVADPSHIFIYPLFGLVVLLVNFIIAASLFRHRNFKVFTQLLLAAAALFGLFLSLVVLFIYLINFR